MSETKNREEVENVQDAKTQGSEPAGNVDQHASNEVAVRDEVFNADQVTPAIFEQTNTQIYTSLKGETQEDRIKQYNAVNAADESLSNYIGKTLEVTDMVAHPVTFADTATGEVINALRVVLVGKDGTAYAATSKGVVNSLQKLFAIVGQAPWQPAIKIVPQQVPTRGGFKTTTIRLEA